MRNRPLFTLLSGLLLVLAVAICDRSPAISKPAIFNWSCIAGPGDIINLQGHDLDSATGVMCSVNGGNARNLCVVNRGNNVLHVRLPSMAGVYAITVKKGSEVSNTVFLSRANPMHFDTPEVAAKVTFKIFGRSLVGSDSIPQVSFVGGGKRYRATICGVSRYNEITVQAPENIPLGHYTIAVNNGMTEAWGSAPIQLEVSERGPDCFKLEVPWSATLRFGNNIFNVKTDPRLEKHAVGDGIANDQPAIQAAIAAASKSGGGVVFLPSGKYLVSTQTGAQLEFSNNVVVKGEDRDQTKIIYGSGKPSKDFVFARFYKVSKCGFCHLSIENLNENDAWLNTKSITNAGSPIDRIFLFKVKFALKNGFRVELKGDRIVIKECLFSSDYSTLHLGTSTNARVENNELVQKFGVHLDLTETKNCVVTGNTFIMDANRGNLASGNVRHGIAIGFAQDLAIVHNRFVVVNGELTYNNDGEAILSEGGGGLRTGEETGDVKSVKGHIMTVSKENPRVPETVVAIIGGKGCGQWRRILARTRSVVEVDRPWLVDPDSSSKYSVFRWSNCDTTISDNKFERWLRGVWTYQGSTTDMQVSCNEFKEMDGIFFEPCQNLLTKNGQFNPVWNTTVDHNVLTSQSTSGLSKQKATATHINFTGDLQQTSSLIGTMALNNQIYGNTIRGTGAEFFENDPAQTEGYCNYLRVEAPKFKANSIPAMLGLIFQKNKSYDCDKHAYLLNGGDYQTTIADGDDTNSEAVVTDTTKYWNTDGVHQSVGTVIINTKSVSPKAK